jgi:hypothetical protein
VDLVIPASPAKRDESRNPFSIFHVHGSQLFPKRDPAG